MSKINNDINNNEVKGKNEKDIDLNDWEELGYQKKESNDLDLDLDYDVEDTFEELKIDENYIDNEIKKINK
jgi:hypothetical protein